MLDDSSKYDIEKISHEILKQSKAFDVFPTPVDKILQHTELVVDKGIDLSKVEKGFFDRLREESVEKFKILQSGLSKVKGFFDRREKTIYIDLNQTEGRKNFVKLHETGHGVLPWQNEVMLASDNNETLLLTFEDEFEAEANYFASVTLFQLDRFLAEADKLSLSIKSSMALAKQFGSSIHSALRNYVLKSKKRCALLVLNPIKDAMWNEPSCTKRNVFHSVSFLSEIGELDFPNEFDFTWSFIKDFKFNKRYNDKGEITLTTKIGDEVKATYHFFNNTYNQFVFLFPKGEVNRSKTKIIISSVN
ncbi:MAG: ImmA/IrrE family metallo-endopeptidase [bacterium]|nr:ImmA/IrrE family metallo-endopeptidase [bacterium]